MCLMEKLTFQEEEIMLIIWQVKEGVIKDFLNCMEEPRPALYDGGFYREKSGEKRICTGQTLWEHLCLFAFDR